MNIELPAILPILFSEVEFINSHADEFAIYVDMRVKGYHGQDAIRAAFGAANGDNNAALRCAFLEATAQYAELFTKRLKEIPVTEILNERIAIHLYMAMNRDPYKKESVRVQALKEACVIAGVTVIDDKGNTKRRGLGDFYKEVQAIERTLEGNRAFVEKGKPLPGDTPTTH